MSRELWKEIASFVIWTTMSISFVTFSRRMISKKISYTGKKLFIFASPEFYTSIELILIQNSGPLLQHLMTSRGVYEIHLR